MEKPYVPEKWKNLRLEIDKNNYKDKNKDKNNIEKDFRIYEPRIIITKSILKNKKDVFKEKHKRCDNGNYYDTKPSLKCTIL